jgi:hypothetical protein
VNTAQIIRTPGRVHVFVRIEEDTVVSVDVDDCPDGIGLRFSVPRSHLPMSARRDLVEAAFDLPQLRSAHEVKVSLPLGDAELLGHLQAHLVIAASRAAGATCLIDGVARPVPAQ